MFCPRQSSGSAQNFNEWHSHKGVAGTCPSYPLKLRLFLIVNILTILYLFNNLHFIPTCYDTLY